MVLKIHIIRNIIIKLGYSEYIRMEYIRIADTCSYVIIYVHTSAIYR